MSIALQTLVFEGMKVEPAQFAPEELARITGEWTMAIDVTGKTHVVRLRPGGQKPAKTKPKKEPVPKVQSEPLPLVQPTQSIVPTNGIVMTIRRFLYRLLGYET